MSDKQTRLSSREKIFAAIKQAGPTTESEINLIQAEAAAILEDSVNARPALLAETAADALIQRVEQGLVIGTSCERINTLHELPEVVGKFFHQYQLPHALQVQDKAPLTTLAWGEIDTQVDLQQDNSVALCMAEYGVAETGSFVIHSAENAPVLLNFLPLYLIAVIPKSKILRYMDEYAQVANQIAAKGNTPRNMCLISGASGTTDIEGVLVQGAHGPEVLHLVIVDDL